MARRKAAKKNGWKTMKSKKEVGKKELKGGKLK
jgi:hypothetical protein